MANPPSQSTSPPPYLSCPAISPPDLRLADRVLPNLALAPQDQAASQQSLAHDEKVSAMDACNQLQLINARSQENLQKMLPKGKNGVANILKGRRTSQEPPRGHCADEPRSSQNKVVPTSKDLWRKLKQNKCSEQTQKALAAGRCGGGQGGLANAVFAAAAKAAPPGEGGAIARRGRRASCAQALGALANAAGNAANVTGAAQFAANACSVSPAQSSHLGCSGLPKDVLPPQAAPLPRRPLTSREFASHFVWFR